MRCKAFYWVVSLVISTSLTGRCLWSLLALLGGVSGLYYVVLLGGVSGLY